MYEDEQSKECKAVLRKNNLNPIKRLGKGGFGLVYLVSKTDFTTYQTQLFSVKCTNKKNFLKKPILRRYLKQEITIMETIHHPNVVQLIRTFQDDGWIFMVMEYCELGNLANFQNGKSNQFLSLNQFKIIIDDVIDGLMAMHSKNIIHRDIKPENILLTKDDSDELLTKICDLGFSRQLQEQAETFCGTTYYMAPQIFAKKKYNQSVDVWALGVLIYVMLFGNHPFKAMNMLKEIQTKCRDGFTLSRMRSLKNDSISPQHMEIFQNLFRDIFVVNFQERISLQEIKRRLNFQKQSLKETVPSETSEQQPTQFYLQEIQFIQEIIKQVSNLNFLTPLEQLALKYYLDKICLCLLHEQGENSSSVSVFSLSEKLRNSQTLDSVSLASNINKVGIKKFNELFTVNSSNDFKCFKQPYRLVVGHAFYKAHKLIENKKRKNQIKLKLFCCHVINRVFEKVYSHSLFKYYYDWLQGQKRLMKFNLASFKEWINVENSDKIIETVEIINNKFYKKDK